MAAPPRTWPNLVGKDGKEAVEIIKKDTGIFPWKKIAIRIFFYF